MALRRYKSCACKCEVRETEGVLLTWKTEREGERKAERRREREKPERELWAVGPFKLEELCIGSGAVHWTLSCSKRTCALDAQLLTRSCALDTELCHWTRLRQLTRRARCCAPSLLAVV